MESQEKSTNNDLYKNKVHSILAHSYSVYFIFFLIGVCLDLVFRFKIFADSFMIPLGIFFLLTATFIIVWAQKTTRNLKKETIDVEIFRKGPYRYTRSPTHFGLFFLMLGFGIVANALFIIMFTLVAFFVTKFWFLNKQEKILSEKYGSHYAEYKKSVKF